MLATNEVSLKERTKIMIESDKDIARWVNNLRSESTKRIYSEGLLKFTEFANLSPKEIVASFQANKKEAEDNLTDFIHEVSKKQTPKSVHNALVSVKSWLLHNDIVMRRKINCGNIKRAPTTEDEKVPTQDEVNRILNYSDLRGKAFISLIAFAGFRPSTAVSIKLRDIPDLIITSDTVSLTNKPAQIKVKPEFSKNARPYFTFLSSEGCDYVLEYLRSRINEGEKLSPDSTVLSFSQKSSRHSITRKGFSKKIKRTFEKAGYNGRPYVLRSYFDTAILNSGLSYIYQQFFMGHAGTIEATYTVNKNLPQSQIDEMRQQFKGKVEPKLESITVRARSEIDLVRSENQELKVLIDKQQEQINKIRGLLSFLIEKQKVVAVPITEDNVESLLRETPEERQIDFTPNQRMLGQRKKLLFNDVNKAEKGS